MRKLIENKLKELIPLKKINFQKEPHIGSLRPDFIAEVVFKNWRFSLVGEIIKQPSSSLFRHALSQLKSYVSYKPDLIPIMIAEYLSPQRRRECRQEGIYYLDLSGNAYLQYDEGLYIDRSGFPNQFPEVRKGRSPFSDKASLILRAMLIKKKLWGVRDLAKEIRLDPGYVSRLFNVLEELNYMGKINSKGRLKNRKSILEDWIHHYDYKKNEFIKYYCLAKSPQEIMNILKKLNLSEKMKYALGYHAGGYLISPHAVFNEVHVYISDKKSLDLLQDQLNLKPVDQGANIIFVYPYYKHSVFYDKQKINELWVVSDIQLYLDLYKYPLRGVEQAEHLYDKRLKSLIEYKDLPDDG